MPFTVKVISYIELNDGNSNIRVNDIKWENQDWYVGLRGIMGLWLNI